MSLQPGTVYAGFAIERLLGAGGMGAVYLAEHPRMRRRVALKVLSNTFTVDAKARAAFDREATLAAGLDHPNIVPVYDRSAVDEPALWLAMRYIDGGDAAGLLSEHPQGLDPVRAVGLLTDAAHALDHAHAQGVLHRDVKPANLLIESDTRHGERAVLTDFGIARTLDDTVTLSGVAATFAYAAPERFEDTPADHRADIYSLGCTLFQLLTGQPPFPRRDQAAVIGAHLTAPPPAPRAVRPDLPAEFDEVIATALAKSPRDRYATCTALAEAAARALPKSTAPVVISRDDDEPTVACRSVSLVKATDKAAVSLVKAPDQAAVPTIVRAAPVREVPPPEIAPEPPADGSRRRRFAVVSGLLLAGVGVTLGAAFTLRDETPSTGTPPTTTSAPQQITSTTTTVPSSIQVTSTPSPVEAPPPADTPVQVENQPVEEPPAEQYVPTYTVERPSQPTNQAPQVVPQTRVHQFGG
ncbi:serine/threonine-protein kinase [Nocardia sp. NPDC050406]|uniref:serine/threonine-protein kinase n=1 Tax=Nocardia sp. NPDC050406 TaxID=3364318 RepID=UPI00378CCFF9